METLRRAVLYAKTDAAAAAKLFAALRDRAARGGDTPTAALARFDLGYAIEAAKQVRYVPEGGTTIGPAVERRRRRARAHPRRHRGPRPAIPRWSTRPRS